MMEFIHEIAKVTLNQGGTPEPPWRQLMSCIIQISMHGMEDCVLYYVLKKSCHVQDLVEDTLTDLRSS